MEDCRERLRAARSDAETLAQEAHALKMEKLAGGAEKVVDALDTADRWSHLDPDDG